MIENIANWRIILYLITYGIGALIGYFGMTRYYKKNKSKERIFIIIYVSFSIIVMGTLVSAPHISAIQVIVLLAIWGTSGWMAIMAYYIHKAFIKKNED